MNMKKNPLNSLFLACTLGTVFFTNAEITIQYTPSASTDTEPAISKVFFTNGSEKKELPHVTLAQLVDEKAKNTLDRKDTLLKSWKQFYIAQTITYLAAGAAYITNYINGNKIAKFKKNRLMEEFIKKCSSVDPWKYKVAASACFIGLAAYPLVRYFKFFDLHSIDFYLPYDQVEGKIAVFRKKTYSHSVHIGNSIVHYYKTSDPVGYMTLDEKEKEFEPVHQASKRMHLSLLSATLCGAGLIWMAAR